MSLLNTFITRAGGWKKYTNLVNCRTSSNSDIQQTFSAATHETIQQCFCLYIWVVLVEQAYSSHATASQFS